VFAQASTLLLIKETETIVSVPQATLSTLELTLVMLIDQHAQLLKHMMRELDNVFALIQENSLILETKDATAQVDNNWIILTEDVPAQIIKLTMLSTKDVM
jgi:microcompartment protein CcmK/EutM